jgi:hypothetical protein
MERGPFSMVQNVYLTCSEKDYSSVFGKLPARGGILMGIVGSIDPVLGYISEVKPEANFLFDLNSYVLEYFDFRMNLTKGSKHGVEYWKNLRSLLLKKKNVSAQDLPDCVEGKDIDPTNLVYILNNGLSAHRNDNEFFEREVSCGWSSPQRYEYISRLQNNTDELRVYKEDICGSGFDRVYKESEESGLEVTLVHLSNILQYLLSDKIDRLYENLQHGIDKGLLSKDCRIIEYDSFMTEVNEPQEYLQWLQEYLEYQRTREEAWNARESFLKPIPQKSLLRI